MKIVEYFSTAHIAYTFLLAIIGLLVTIVSAKRGFSKLKSIKKFSPIKNFT